MITIFHGDDTASSRKEFITHRERLKTAISFSKDLVLTDLVQIIEGGELFTETKNIFIEDFLSKRKPGKDQKEIVDFLNKHQDSNIYLWEGKEIDKRKLFSFPKATLKLYKFPQMLFTFLDSLKPGSGKTLIPLFHKTISSSEPELVFFMIIRQFRLMIAVLEPSPKNISELARISWQRIKLERQAEKFGKEKLLKNYKRLFEIDLGNKTGTLNMPLTTAIDFFLLDL